MKMTIRDIPQWQGKRALVREDFNVPLDAQGRITDDTRIREALPTLQYLLNQGAKVVVMSHLGRPKGQVKPEFSLKPVFQKLKETLAGVNVQFSEESDFSQLAKQTQAMQNGDLLLLENVRFLPGEEKNDPALAKQLAGLGDVYVNDAFGTAHRAHASTEGVAHHLSPKVAGFLMDKEITALSTVLNSAEPLTAIIGGSKVSTKITVLENLLPKVRHLVIGGGMAFTFLKAQGCSVGKSLVEDDFIPTATDLLEKSRQSSNVTLVLPQDVLVADDFNQNADTMVQDADAIPDGWMGLDIGPKSIESLCALLEKSPLVLWNGPLGVFEMEKFAKGTRAVAEKLAALTRAGQCKSILGGGDTVAAIQQFGIPVDAFTHVSTGGGASLEFLEGKSLPGIATLDDAPVKAPV